MLGKPPTLAYRGFGYDAKSAISTPPNNTPTRRYPDKDTTPTQSLPIPRTGRRPSFTSSVFSDYDDLRDFEGRFDSRSTLGARSSGSQRSRTRSESKPQPSFTRKTSKGFLTRFKGGSHPQPPSPDKPSPLAGGRRLKALRSMGSLRRSSTTQSNKGSTIAIPLKFLRRSPSMSGLTLIRLTGQMLPAQVMALAVLHIHLQNVLTVVQLVVGPCLIVPLHGHPHLPSGLHCAQTFHCRPQTMKRQASLQPVPTKPR